MKAKSLVYWTTTILVAFSMSGGIAQLARVPGVVDGFVRVLGYPPYFVTILGFWKVLGA
ncbi:MAG TPA: DoxX family protein, partial [Acidobacteriaceae bacterium]